MSIRDENENNNRSSTLSKQHSSQRNTNQRAQSNDGSLGPIVITSRTTSRTRASRRRRPTGRRPRAASRSRTRVSPGSAGHSSTRHSPKRTVQNRRRIRLTVGRRGDLRIVRDRADGAERLGWLAVCLNGTGRVGVHTRVVLVVSLAGAEGAVCGGVGCVICAPNAVVDVFAEAGGVGTGGVAGFKTEDVAAHEARVGVISNDTNGVDGRLTCAIQLLAGTLHSLRPMH